MSPCGIRQSSSKLQSCGQDSCIRRKVLTSLPSPLSLPIGAMGQPVALERRALAAVSHFGVDETLCSQREREVRLSASGEGARRMRIAQPIQKTFGCQSGLAESIQLPEALGGVAGTRGSLAIQGENDLGFGERLGIQPQGYRFALSLISSAHWSLQIWLGVVYCWVEKPLAKVVICQTRPKRRRRSRIVTSPLTSPVTATGGGERARTHGWGQSGAVPYSAATSGGRRC